MDHVPGLRNFPPGNRLHSIVKDLLIVIDAIFIAGQAALNLRPTPPFSGARYSLESSRFPLVAILPIAGPFYLAARNDSTATNYGIKFEPWTPDIPAKPTDHQTSQMVTMWHTIFSAFFVLFYERYRPFLQDRFGREVPKWPELFRFCWAIRNAAAHHEARLNFTNPTVGPVTWAGLTYSPSDNGRSIFGPNDLSVGDILILLIDFSDELDVLGTPVL